MTLKIIDALPQANCPRGINVGVEERRCELALWRLAPPKSEKQSEGVVRNNPHKHHKIATGCQLTFEGYSSVNSMDMVYSPPAHGEPSFPGIAHSHLRKFVPPSAFFPGLAVNPNGWSFLQFFRSSCSRLLAIPPPDILPSSSETERERKGKRRK